MSHLALNTYVVRAIDAADLNHVHGLVQEIEHACAVQNGRWTPDAELEYDEKWAAEAFVDGYIAAFNHEHGSPT